MVRSNISKIWSILSFLNLITNHIGREIIQIYSLDRSLVKTQRTRVQMLDMRLILSDYSQIITINNQILEHSLKIKKIKAQFKLQIYHKSLTFETKKISSWKPTEKFNIFLRCISFQVSCIDRKVNIPANICLFKVNNRNTRKRCELGSKLTIKKPERRPWRHSVVFIVNFDHISQFF